MKEVAYGFFGMLLFFILVGLLERWNMLDPVLDVLGIPR